MIITKELDSILNDCFDGNNKTVKIINSLPGTGKTTSIRLLCEKFSYLRFLYLSYNVSNVSSANMPDNVCAMSFHKLAFSVIGRHYSHKLSNDVELVAIKNRLNLRWRDAGYVKGTLEKWFMSSDENIGSEHTGIDKLSKSQSIAEGAKAIWKYMCNVNDNFPISHDGYFKGFTLGEIDLSKYFDVIVVDEFQDINPCFGSFLEKQINCEMVFIGDDNQQIYRYRGAENIVSRMSVNRSVKTFELSNSFRFGNEIAEVGNRYLALLGRNQEIVGLGKENVEESIQIISSDMIFDEQYAYLGRKFITVINKAIQLYSQNKSIFWIGGVSSYNFSEIYDVLNLKNNRRSKIKNKFLINNFESFEVYKSAAKSSNDYDMCRIIAMIEQFGDSLYGMLSALESNAVSTLSEAHAIVGTAHKSKGSEFDNVCLLDDFSSKERLQSLEEDERIDELRLQLVAVTRAKKRLIITEVIADIIDFTPCTAGKII